MAVGVGIGVGLGRRRRSLYAIDDLTHTAMWRTDQVEVASGAVRTAYNMRNTEGTDYDLRQHDVAGDRPAFSSGGGVNGRSKATFDGAGDKLVCGASRWGSAIAQPYTILVVAKVLSFPLNLDNEFLFDGEDGANRGAVYLNGGPDTFSWYAGTEQNVTAWDTVLHWIACVFNGASSFAIIDDTATTGNLNVGAAALEGAVLGADNAFIRSAHFEWYETRIFPAALSAGTINGDVKDYLNDYYGQANFPAAP